MMKYTKPIYITRKDTFLASDKIIPYGDRIGIISESMSEEVALELLKAFKTDSEEVAKE